MAARRQLRGRTFDRMHDCFEGFAKAARMARRRRMASLIGRRH